MQEINNLYSEQTAPSLENDEERLESISDKYLTLLKKVVKEAMKSEGASKFVNSSIIVSMMTDAKNHFISMNAFSLVLDESQYGLNYEGLLEIKCFLIQ